MSAIQFLREKAGVLVAVVIGISLLLFVISDFFGSGSGQQAHAKKYYEIGRIGKDVVSYPDFEQKVQNLVEIYKLSGTENLDQATLESIREQTWQQIVRERILENQYKKLGIGVSSEEVDELVLGNNPHPVVIQLFSDQETGSFNKSFLVNFLKQIEFDETAKKYWMFFEDEIVNDRMNSKYNSMVSKGLYVTTRQAEYQKKLTSINVDFSYIMKNYSSVPDSLVTVSPSEINSYYEKNKNTFRRNALRDIEYVSFDIVPSEDDIKQAEEWINKTKTEFAEASDPVQFINLTADTRHTGFFITLNEVPSSLNGFIKKEDLNEIYGPYEEDGSFKLARLLEVDNRPDSVHVRHILLSPDAARPIEKARTQADSLIRLLKSGSSFEVLASANSDDKGSAQLGGDLGWFPEGRMIIPFNNACFSGRKGDIVTVETTFGIHIIEILAQSRPVRKYNIGIIDRKIIPGTTTNQRIYSQASQFAGTNNTYEKFTKAVTEQKLSRTVANDITPQQKTLPGLQDPRSLIISLFQTEEGKIVLDNNQQAVFEIGDKYVIGYCTRIQNEGIAPLRDVENDIRFILFKEKKAEILSAEFIKNNEPGRTLDDIADLMGLTVQDATQVSFRSYTLPGVGSEPALIAASVAAKKDTVAGPVKGENGVYMLTVNNISAPERSDDLNILKERLQITYQMRGSYEAYDALRKKANIEDKRYKFY